MKRVHAVLPRTRYISPVNLVRMIFRGRQSGRRKFAELVASAGPDGLFIKKGPFKEPVYVTGTRQFLSNTHNPKLCKGQGCPVHHPSDHTLRHMRTHWRGDRGLMERICKHGVGHPDPDHLDFVERTSGKEAADVESVHGCDGCCR